MTEYEIIGYVGPGTYIRNKKTDQLMTVIKCNKSSIWCRWFVNGREYVKKYPISDLKMSFGL